MVKINLFEPALFTPLCGKMWTCINHLTCVRECVCAARALTWQSAAFLLGGDVMRTRSPLADREPCLCSPPEEKPHCVSESKCVWGCMCVCVSLCLTGILAHGGGGEAKRHSRGSTFPCRSGRGNHLLMPSSQTYQRKRKFLMFCRAR